jgi:uncharacterized protein YxeA
MSTFIINLNDTIAMSDSAVVELAKVISSCQPCIRGTETNCNDVIIVAFICLAIVFVAFIAVFGFLYWKSMEIKADQEEREFQKTKEKEECQRKLDANKNNRSNMLEDEERKRKYAKDDKELERKYAIEDEERKRKYAKDDKELERKYAIEDEELKTKKQETHS